MAGDTGANDKCMWYERRLEQVNFESDVLLAVISFFLSLLQFSDETCYRN